MTTPPRASLVPAVSLNSMLPRLPSAGLSYSPIHSPASLSRSPGVPCSDTGGSHEQADAAIAIMIGARRYERRNIPGPEAIGVPGSCAGFARETGNFDDRWSPAPEYFGELGIFPPECRSSAVRHRTRLAHQRDGTICERGRGMSTTHSN